MTVSDPAALAARIDAVLVEIGARAGEPAQASVEGLVRELMQFYGTGLAQIVETLRAGAGPDMVQRIAANPLVGALLALHDLHPVERSTRLRYAIDNARRRLGSHGEGIELTGVDGEGMVRVRIPSGCGTDTIREIVETAVAEMAPDTEGVRFDTTPAGPVMLRIEPRPPAEVSP